MQRIKIEETLQLWRRAMPIAPGSGPSSKAHEMCDRPTLSVSDSESRCLKELEDTDIAIEFLHAHIDTLQVSIVRVEH